jgi:KDO2-lipid IV(A) lauroyltransferase
METKKIIKRNLVLSLFFMVRFFSRLFPFKTGLALFGLFGRLCYYALPYYRGITLENLRSALPEKSDEEIRKTAKDSFTHHGKNLFEILNMKRIRRRFDDYVTMEGESYLRDAVKNGGCVYITGHVGNWELMAYYMAYKGFNMTPIAKELYDTRLNDILVNLREENGVHLILRGKPDTSRNIIRALKGDGVLAMLVDQDTSVKGIFVDFFGKKAYTPIGAASLALKFKSGVVSGFIHREGNRHKLVMTPLGLVDTGNKESDIISNTELYSNAVEKAVRKHPAQWVWMHRRWKTKPDNEASENIADGKS